jgi:putative transposase
MCSFLGVSTSGYYAWLKRGRSARDIQNEELLAKINMIHKANREVYGAPRIHAELALRYGIRCSRKRVARLMRVAGLEGIYHRKRQGCTRRNEQDESHPDLVQRQFERSGPNELWVADLTQQNTAEGWLYLATVMDTFSRRVVGWSAGVRANAELVSRALDMAIWNRRPEQVVIHHSDHGSQYTALAFTKRLEAAGLIGSMGTVGDALDNAAAESLFATLKKELLKRNRWKTRKELTTAIFDYIEGFYNRVRLHSALGYLSPEDFERRVADSKQTSDLTRLRAADS